MENKEVKTYIGTGRIEILGNHTDHQGGRVMVAPSVQKIWAEVTDNGQDVIRIESEGFKPFKVDLVDSTKSDTARSALLVTGMLVEFSKLFGAFEAAGNGFDAHIKSEVAVGSGLSSSAAFEILLARIINERYFGGRADAVQLAKIAQVAERDYYGKPCGLMDQLSIALGQPAMIDFITEEPGIELLDMDLGTAGYSMEIIPTDSSHDDLDAEYASVPDDMFAVAHELGIVRLGEIGRDEFLAKLPELEAKVKDGTLTDLQLDRARHFYDETERVLEAANALKAGDAETFVKCVDASGRSSENLLKNVTPPGVAENGLSRALDEYKAKPETAAVRLVGGGFGGSILVIKRI